MSKGARARTGKHKDKTCLHGGCVWPVQPLLRSSAMLELSLSRGDKWDPTPTDETVDLISSLDHPAFDVLDYLNWCRFLDKDMKATIGPDDN